MTSEVELVPISEGNRVTLKADEKLTVGRGSSLGCDDKKISRHHAELVLKDDGTLWITPTHTNPVFYRSSQGKTTQLDKDQAHQLKDTDQIGLLPTSYFFRISFLKNDATTVRKLPEWMTDSTSSAKRHLIVVSDDENDDEKKKPSGATGFDQDADSTASPAKKSKTSTRPACPYGATCYRKNPTHRTEQSHPGDSDDGEKDENDSKTTATNRDDKPVCPYGKTCYRKNPQHRSDYQH